NDSKIFLLRHALRDHASQVRVVIGIPPIGGAIDGALVERDDAILMAAGDNGLTEEAIRVDPDLVQIEPRGVVAGGRVGIDKADRLTLEIMDVLIGTVGFYIDHRVVPDR